jgi:excisionase family DNA binding protein
MEAVADLGRFAAFPSPPHGFPLLPWLMLITMIVMVNGKSNILWQQLDFMIPNDPSVLIPECRAENLRSQILVVREAAERLGVSTSMVYLLCGARRLDHFRLRLGRGTIRIRETDLQAYLEGCKVASNQKHHRLGRS